MGPDPATEAAAGLGRLGPDARVRIVARADASGIAAAAILVRAFHRIGRSFHVTYTHERDPARIAAGEAPGEATLFVGIPGGTPGRGLRIVLGVDGASNPPSEVFFLPSEGRPPAAAWDLACRLEARNEDLAPLVLIGTDPATPSSALESKAREQGLRDGSLQAGTGPRWPALALRDLVAWPQRPWRFLPGSEDPDAFLTDFGLPPQATPHELDEHEAAALAGIGVLRSLQAGTEAARIHDFFGPSVRFRAHRGLQLARLTALCDAAALEGEAGSALAFLLGDDAAFAELEAAETRAHERLRALIVQAIPRRPPHGELWILGTPDARYAEALGRALFDRIFGGEGTAVVTAATATGISVRAFSSHAAILEAVAKAGAALDGTSGRARLLAWAEQPASSERHLQELLQTAAGRPAQRVLP